MLIGLDVLRNADFALLRGNRVGLVTHPAAIDEHYVAAADLFAAHTNLIALFGPKHGLTGEAQDLIPVAHGGGPVRVHSLYGDTFASLKPTPEQLAGLDVLVIDMQDVGSRYYTFQATMLYCLEACAAVGLPVIVLDRQNPIGGDMIEGPSVSPGFDSFVGVHPIPIRHGMTIGELATLYRAERVPGVDLTVIRCEELTRHIGIPLHVPPSPNMPTFATAAFYPGMCLLEGTNLSEGRGTTRPFEYFGHPGLNPRKLADALNAAGLPGAQFLPATFRPTFQKYANQSCGGCLILRVENGLGPFRPVRTGLTVLIECRRQLGERFQWRTERYEFVDRIPAIDLLFGSDRERLQIEDGREWVEIAEGWKGAEAAFHERRRPFLLYPE